MLLRHNEWSPPKLRRARVGESLFCRHPSQHGQGEFHGSSYERCAGLDVHKKSITACVLWALPKGKKKQEKRRFATFTQDLLAMTAWLRECGVTHVAMESTVSFRQLTGQ